MTKLTLLLFFVFASEMRSNGQTLLVNKGALISVKANTQIGIRQGGFLNDPGGTTQHAGYLLVEGDVINNNIIENVGASTIQVKNDFINNQVFISGDSWVNLYGGQQSIGGTSSTVFHDLEISGTGIKTLITNAEVQNSLRLNDLELSIGENILVVTNPDIGAITRTNGFVSSLGDGALDRNTNSVQDYLFPVGSSIQPARYRPIIVHPVENTPNVFGVRFANANATDEGFDTQNLDNNIESVNTHYFHRIYHRAGASFANISFYPLPNDGDWNAVSYWDSQWQSIDNQIVNTSNSISIEHWNPTQYIPYILTKVKDISIYIPNAFSPNDDGENDIFTVFANEQISSIKHMEIFDRWGSLIYEANNLSPNEEAGFWDGTFRGRKLDPGVFVYSLTVLTYDGLERQYNGSVTIIK